MSTRVNLKRFLPIFLLVFLLVGVVSNDMALAQRKWPAKPIEMLAGYGPGGTTDLTNRIVAGYLTKHFNVPVVCGNMAGGGTSVLAAWLATQKPDGYKFGLISSTALTAMPHMRVLPYTDKSFTILLMLAPDPMDLVVLQDSPYKTFEDFVADAKKNPGKLTYSNSGKGCNDHLIMEWLAEKIGIKVEPVPAPSGPESMALVIGKHVTFGIGSGSHMHYVNKEQTGQMRVLLELDNYHRWGPGIKNIPDILAEESKVSSFRLYVGPKNLPEKVVKGMKEGLAKAVEEETYKKLCDRFQMGTVYEFENLGRILGAEYKEMEKLIKAVGLAVKK